MKGVHAAHVYAHAIYPLIERAFDEAMGEIDRILALFDEVPGLVTFLDYALIGRDERKELIRASLGDSVHPHVSSLVCLLIDKKKCYLLTEIFAALRRIRMQQAGLTEVSIESACALSGEEQSILVERIEEHLRGKIVPRFIVDKDLIEGFAVRIGNTVFDNTLLLQLRSLRDSIVIGSEASAGKMV